MKIGIITIHAAHNYGAMLQAYALQEAIKELGYKVEIIDYYPQSTENQNKLLNKKTIKAFLTYLYSKINPNIRRKLNRFEAFRKAHHKLTKRYYNNSELHQSKPEFDGYIVGSDQVWNLDSHKDPSYFLDFVEDSKLKFSYASSFGTNNIPKEDEVFLKNSLQKFNSISVRELDGLKILNHIGINNVALTLDPTFLIKPKQWESIEKTINNEGRYILVYGIHKSSSTEFILRHLSENLKLPIYAIPMGLSFPYKVDRIFNDAGPGEFIHLFRKAAFTITSSFHGLAFSIIFKRNFITIPHKTRNSRLDSLLQILNLTNRQINDTNQLTRSDLVKENINYSEVDKILDNYTSSSYAFLDKNLSKIHS